jgi:REP-associated tyrosine transposase
MEFRRKNIRLQRTSYLGLQWYFLTACTQDRVPRLRDAVLVSDHLKFLVERAAADYFAIQAYCFMPDHLHLLVSGTSDESDCMGFMNGFKQKSAFMFKQQRGERLWQHKTFDHILRPNDRWEGVAYYIWMNPVRKGLCLNPGDWPFSGSKTIDWKSLLRPSQEAWVPAWKRTTVVRSAAL